MNKQLLADVERALNDWVLTYAWEECDPEHVRQACKRISDSGGTLAYITELRERVTAIRRKK